MKFIIYTDGASRNNPGLASYGYAIFNEKGENIFREGKYIGIATNNVAEYTAVLASLKKAIELGASEVSYFADSKLVVEQLSGRYKIKSPHLKDIVLEIKQLESRVYKITYHHIPREQNTLADALANQALDSL